jgi:hypothetical protein
VHWSIYDVLILVSGLITLVIVVAPVAGISTRTRLASGGIGGGLVLISLVLASVPFFRYPSVVMIAPVIALLAVVAVIGKAVRGGTSLQVGEQGHRLSAEPQIEPLDHLSPIELMEVAARDHSRWLEIARHPAAYPGLLDWLWEHGGPEVRDAVATRRNVDSQGSPSSL